MSWDDVSLIVDPMQTCVEIAVPSNRYDAIRSELDDVTMRAGGCTRITCSGDWVNGRGAIVSEAVILHRWWFPAADNYQPAVNAVTTVIRALLNLGEEAVLMQESDSKGTEAFVFSRPQSDIELRD